MTPTPVPQRNRYRLLAAWCAVALLVGIVGLALQDDGTDLAVADASSTATSTTTSSDAGTPGEGDATAVAGSDAADVTTTIAAGGGDDASTAATTTPTTTATTTPATTTTVDPRRVTTPGTYTYDTKGTVDGEKVEGTSTLTVSAPDADGRQTHVQKGDDGTTTTVYRHTLEGTYLESLTIEAAQGSFSLKAETPYLLLPADAAPGTTTKGTLTGNGVTAKITFTLKAMNAQESTATLDAVLSGTVSGVKIDGTMNSTIVARTSDQLPLRIDARTDITAGGGLFTSKSDTTTELRR